MPKSVWAFSKNVNGYGVAEWIFEDYNGRRSTITLPYTAIGLPEPKFEESYIISHGSILGSEASPLLLRYQEESSFSRHWAEYPFRPEIFGVGTKGEMIVDIQSEELQSVEQDNLGETTVAF